MKYFFLNTHKKGILSFALLISFFFSIVGYSQFDIPDAPKKIEDQTSLYDYANILSKEEQNNLEQKLIHYSDSTSTQIVIITIPSLKGEDISILSTNWAHKWGIGQAEEDNGVLILFARDDRRIHISPGYGVEDRLTAGILGQMIRDVIIPEFKKGNYYLGLDKGTDAIIDILKGKYKASPKEDATDEFPIVLFIFFVFFIIFIIIATKGGGGGNGRYRGTLGDTIILSSSGRSGSSFGGSGSGGFGGGGFGGGFGGGGFSGGGAGGSW